MAGSLPWLMAEWEPAMKLKGRNKPQKALLRKRKSSKLVTIKINEK